MVYESFRMISFVHTTQLCLKNAPSIHPYTITPFLDLCSQLNWKQKLMDYTAKALNDPTNLGKLNFGKYSTKLTSKQ